MYVIVMDNEKQLTPTIRQAIYRGENMMDDIKFLLPLKYKKFDLSEFIVTLQYIQNQKIISHDSCIFKRKRWGREDYPVRHVRNMAG